MDDHEPPGLRPSLTFIGENVIRPQSKDSIVLLDLNFIRSETGIYYDLIPAWGLRSPDSFEQLRRAQYLDDIAGVRLRSIFLFLLLTAVAVLILSRVIPAQGDSSSVVLVTSNSGAPGSDVAINVEIHDVPSPGLGQWNVDLHYPSGTVDVVSCTADPENVLSAARCLPSFDPPPDPSIVRIFGSNTSLGASGNIVLARIVFRLADNATGCAPLLVNLGQVTDLPYATFTATSELASTATQTATHTPTPTQTLTPASTYTPTPTPANTSTSTPTATSTPTVTATATVTATGDRNVYQYCHANEHRHADYHCNRDNHSHGNGDAHDHRDCDNHSDSYDHRDCDNHSESYDYAHIDDDVDPDDHRDQYSYKYRDGHSY